MAMNVLLQIAFAGLGDGFRRHRKMMQSALSASSIPSYRPLVVAETYPFLRRMMESPQNYMTHLRRYAFWSAMSYAAVPESVC